MTKKKIKMWGWILCVTAFGGIAYSLMLAFGNTTPGSIFERSSYTTKAYILIYSSGMDTKNYRIPAEIEKQDSRYWIIRAYWPNGGAIEFNDCFNAKLSERISCKTNNGKYYWVQLTSDLVKQLND